MAPVRSPPFAQSARSKDLSGVNVSVEWEVSGLPEVDAPEMTGIWFLRRAPGAGFTPLPLVAATVRFVGQHFSPIDPAEPPLPISGSPYERRPRDTVHAVERDSSNLYIWNWAELTREESDPAMARAFSALAASPQASVKAFGISGLIRDGASWRISVLLAKQPDFYGQCLPDRSGGSGGLRGEAFAGLSGVPDAADDRPDAEVQPVRE